MIGTDCPANGSNSNVDVQGRNGNENFEKAGDVTAALLHASAMTRAVAAPIAEQVPSMGKAEQRWRRQREGK